jgi:outer membrane lipoprotein-sorting protein
MPFASHRVEFILRVFCALAVFMVLAATSACRIRKTVKIEVPEKIQQAKVAGFDELISVVNAYADRISSLSSSTMKATYTSGKVETGVIQTYHSAPGYILLRQPDEIRINIQNPITKTSIAEMLSVGDNFQLWVPSKNKLYLGENSLKEFAAEGQSEGAGFAIRPIHIYDAIVPARLSSGMAIRWMALEEDQDATTKYYVLTGFKEIGSERLFPTRKLWIDRSNLTIARQQFFDEGRLTGIVSYSDLTLVGGIWLPLSIRIERPVDGYTLYLTFRTWNLNPVLEDAAFILTIPEAAERIVLREKGRR